MKNISGHAGSWLTEEERTEKKQEEIEVKEKDIMLINEKKENVIAQIRSLKSSIQELYKINVDKRTGDAMTLVDQLERTL